METNYLIIPGYGNSESEHWQTYFEEKLLPCIRNSTKSWDGPI
ncbi:MAG: alpha/beta hydrolase [Bacteroidales bacterium]|nr:alpha/beta hydrolase [Bacteroidales bacterium]